MTFIILNTRENEEIAVFEIKNLYKKIKNRIILNNITMEIPSKSIVGFIGPNGAGKTTTFKLCCGISSINSGEILINDISIKKDFEQYMSKIGSSLNNTNFYNKFTAIENAKIFSSPFRVNDKKIEETIELVGLSNRKDSLVGTYSLGMRQRLSIALSILHEPEIVFLDEPFNGVDPKGIQDLRKIIKTICNEKGTSFIVSSHNLGEISKIASQNYYINNGKIVKQDKGTLLHSMVDIKVNNPEAFINVLNEMAIDFSSEGNFFFLCVKNDLLNSLFNKILHNNIIILEFSSGTHLEKKYLEMMGESEIE